MRSTKVFKLQRIKRAIQRQHKREREDAYEARIQHVLSLPLAEALPLMREAINEDFRLLWRKDVTQWCVRYSKEILALHKEGKL